MLLDSYYGEIEEIYAAESTIFSDDCIKKTPSTKTSYLKDQPKPDQRSLLMIFDTTGSMGTDLVQLKQSASEIVQELSTRADNPIYNYILVEFNDPGRIIKGILNI